MSFLKPRTPDVLISEVGPRDGLQSVAATMPTADKLRWIDALHAAGVREIEVASFVPARLLPQMAYYAHAALGHWRATGQPLHVASAYLVFVAIDEHGASRVIPALEPETPDEHRRVREAEIRRAHRLARKEEIDEGRTGAP